MGVQLWDIVHITNGYWSQFTSKFLDTLCMELGIKTVKTAEYNPQATGHVESFNVTMMSRLSSYVTEYQKDLDTFLYSLAYVYDVQVYQNHKAIANHTDDQPITS